MMLGKVVVEELVSASLDSTLVEFETHSSIVLKRTFPRFVLRDV